MQFNLTPPEVDLLAILPMIIIAITGMVALILDMARPHKSNDTIVAISLLGVLAAGLALVNQLPNAAMTTMADMVTIDKLSVVGQLIILISVFLVVLFSDSYLKQKKVPFGEFYPLLLWSALGGMIMCSTRNLLALFVGIEVLSISLYVMAGMSRGEEKSEESALKYFLLGSFATGFLLMGIAFLYGGSGVGSLNMDTLAFAMTRGTADDKILLVIGACLVFVGLGFKSSFVPFHQWTPDVYQGSPTNITAFMATGAKAGAFIAVWRFLEMTAGLKDYFLPAIAVIAAITMTVGNFVALNQKDVKRLMAYSSIANAGYVLAALVAHAASPIKTDSSTLIFFLISYTLMTVGTFAVIALSAKDGKELTSIEGLRGLRQRAPLAAFALAIFVLSLIGIPPTPGFFGKLLIFRDLLTGGFAWLAILLAINSVVSIGYYFSLISNAFTPEDARIAETRTDEVLTTQMENTGVESTPVLYPTAGTNTLSPAFAGTLILCLAGIVAVVILYTPLMTAINPK